MNKKWYDKKFKHWYITTQSPFISTLGICTSFCRLDGVDADPADVDADDIIHITNG